MIEWPEVAGSGAMSTARACGLAGLIVVLVAVGSDAKAFKSGGWEGEASKDESGRFSNCTMTADYKNGITLGFIISRDFDWGIVLANDKWNLNVGSTEAVKLAIDARKPLAATAKVVDAHGILIPLENADPVVNAMRLGRRLNIVTPAGKVSFRLTGTGDAIAALAACVSTSLEMEKSGGGISALETKAAGDPKDRPNKLFTQSEAVAFATNLLASAGISDYQLIDPAKNPMPNFDVVWTYANGMMGAIAGFKDMGAVDLDEAASVVMADDAKNCHGDFASGKKLSEPVQSVTVKRLFTACRNEGNAVEIHYTLIKTASGNLIQLAHLNAGGASGDIANADSAFLQGKVLPSFR
jgi:hypothetical protein